MLKSVHIQNYRSCKNTRLSGLGVLTALIGRNGAGKTNILKAIEWTARTALGRPYPKHSDILGNSTYGAVSLEFDIDGCAYSYSVSRFPDETTSAAAKRSEKRIILKERLERVGHEDVVVLRREGERVVLGSDDNEREIAISAATAAMPAIVSLLPGEDPLSEELNVIQGYLDAVRYYPLEPPQASITSYFIPGEEYLKWLPNAHTSSASPEHTAMRIVTLFLERRDEFDELTALLGVHGLGLIVEIEITTIGSQGDETQPRSYILSFKPMGVDRSISFGDLSFGTQRIVQLITAILFSPSSIALIEQPEDGIHPGLLHKITPLLRDYSIGSQIIIASHAPGVLNRIEPEEVRIVRNEEGFTVVSALTEEQIASAHMYLEDDGPLSDYIETL